MAIQFCDECGDTLSISVHKLVPCDCCGKENNSEDIYPETTVQRLAHFTHPDKILNVTVNQKSSNFPSYLRSKVKQNIQQLTLEDRQNRGAIIQRECPKCHASEATYVELQLRSADEGSTIMYTSSLVGRSKSVRWLSRGLLLLTLGLDSKTTTRSDEIHEALRSFNSFLWCERWKRWNASAR